MTKVKNIFNDGSKTGAKVGTVRVDGGNIWPDGNVLAIASTGKVITEDMLNMADFFQCAQTSAATDLILLPTDAPIGAKLVIYAITSFALRTEAAADKINNVAGTTAVYTVPAAATLKLQKVNSTGWSATSVNAAGAAVQVIPAT